MKNILIITIILGCLASSCDKESEGISRETQLPVITLTGPAYLSIKPGGTFVDPGVKATEAGKEIEVKSTGTVNAAKEGVYQITYSAINSDGFPATASRTVVVADIAADAAAVDLSGEYARTTNGSIAVWTRIAPGVYTVFNPGGAPGTNLTVVATSPTTTRVEIPEQKASDGSDTHSEGSPTNYNPVTKTYTWKIINPGYGTGDRTFVKQ